MYFEICALFYIFSLFLTGDFVGRSKEYFGYGNICSEQYYNIPKIYCWDVFPLLSSVYFIIGIIIYKSAVQK